MYFLYDRGTSGDLRRTLKRSGMFASEGSTRFGISRKFASSSSYPRSFPMSGALAFSNSPDGDADASTQPPTSCGLSADIKSQTGNVGGVGDESFPQLRSQPQGRRQYAPACSRPRGS